MESLTSLSVTVVIGVLLASAASFTNTFFSSPKPVLYCVPSDSVQFITTLDPSLPQAKCFRVANGVFTEILKEIPSSDEEFVTLDGYVFPGIIESHGHILQYGEMLESVPLYGAENIDEVISRVKKFLADHAGEGYGTRKKWVRGIGWDQAHFGGVMPTAKDLGADPALADLYIMLDRVDVHCVWTSQKVLDLLPSPLPDAPPGGVVVSDPGPGVFCDNAMDAIINPIAPKPDNSQKIRWFKTAMAELTKVGITGVGDAGMRPDDIKILEGMAVKKELPLRVNVMLECPERNSFCPQHIWDLKLIRSGNGREGLGDSTLLLGGVKLFADGALGSWGAALLEPYSDKPDVKGTMLINETELEIVVNQWYNVNWQVNIHAIGDRANHAAVNAFESIFGQYCQDCNELTRFRIEHAQIISPEDQRRIAKMGIIPSIQPTHATSDMAYALDRLGSERLQHSAYRMASFIPKDAREDRLFQGPVLGSDFPVEPPNPFHGMYAAVTRLNPATGTSPSGGGGWYPEEALTVDEALHGFTRNAAYGWFQESKTGAIEVGKWSDWIVIDRDILEDKSGKGLRDVKVRQTWMGGHQVYPIPEMIGEDERGLSEKITNKTRKSINKILQVMTGDINFEL
ncbi:amidohydrolase family-domain-containing protein [Bisporella sp. PMI_857]|nr:amidohydrolase family-domain-containing protein [Bisporella sp. PMI_857]